jgi:hypothetical protein
LLLKIAIYDFAVAVDPGHDWHPECCEDFEASSTKDQREANAWPVDRPGMLCVLDSVLSRGSSNPSA